MRSFHCGILSNLDTQNELRLANRAKVNSQNSMERSKSKVKILDDNDTAHEKELASDKAVELIEVQKNEVRDSFLIFFCVILNWITKSECETNRR